MFTRSAFLAAAMLAGFSATASAQAPAAAPQQNPNAPVVRENFEDWTVRCFNVRGPAPCDMLQVAVNKQTQQRVVSVSIAYVPERNAFAIQMVVPLGVALAKGLSMNAGDHSLKNVHFNRCTREGCYVEIIVDEATINAIGRVGPSTMMVVTPYAKTNEVKLPLSLKGWAASVARLKVLAAQRATRGTLGAAPGAAPAAPRPAAPAPAPAPAVPATPTP